MENKKYSITLSDGNIIENLKLNGNNFISEVPVSVELFANNCSPVIISNGEMDELHENMELVQIMEIGDEYWLVLRDISKEEMEQIKMQSDIEYIAMMTGIEL